MALRTFGTNANNSLSAFLVGTDDYPIGQPGTSLGEINTALLNNGIRADEVSKGTFGGNVGTTRFRVNQAYVRNGYLIIPNRGKLVLRNGDYIVFDPGTGWPAVFSGDTVANGPFTHT